MTHPVQPKTQIRLNKYIANTGLCSRRQADDFIERGVVKVNGQVITSLGHKIDPKQADLFVTVNGKSLAQPPKNYTYLMLNKPKGYVVTKDDEHASQTVMDLLPKSLQQLDPVGRLDKHSEGLLLFTNDGELVNRLTHPRFEHEKEYRVTVREPLTLQQVQLLAQGLHLEEGHTGENIVQQLDQFTFTIILHQGWKRQIRRMVKALGYHVVALQRVRIGKLELGKLPRGKWTFIQKQQIC